MSVKNVSSRAVSSRFGDRKRWWRDSVLRQSNSAASPARSPVPTCRSEIRVPLATTKLSGVAAEEAQSALRRVTCRTSGTLVALRVLLVVQLQQARQPGADGL